MSEPMNLVHVTRLDAMPLNTAHFTEEGYFVDKPILTSTGIFEYAQEDGTIRRELRLPEEVFKKESLDSYLGKPIIVTHDAGLITKDNVHDESIGTILSSGYRDGDNVRADIVIHDTDEMKAVGMKELSLGYNLDLEETPGVWNGQPYDAIQRNIFINHLALVLKARAGDQARLNIDGRGHKTKGATAMKQKKHSTRRADGILTPEELNKAIENYKNRRNATKTDEDEVAVEETTVKENTDDGEDDIEARIEAIKANRESHDGDDAPETKKEAMDIVNQQDGDIDELLDLIDTLLAERDMKKNTDGEDCETVDCKKDEDDTEETIAEDEDDPDVDAESNADEDEVVVAEEENEDDDDDDTPAPAKDKGVNMDSVDRLVRQRVQLGIVGNALGIKGLESMNINRAKRTVVRAVNPGIRLDGKSEAYVNAAFDIAVKTVGNRTRKGTSYQKKQMFNGDSRGFTAAKAASATAARERMINRHNNKEDK